MIALKLLATTPQSNPDRLRFLATFSGDYGTGEETGDPLNLAPTVSGQNSGGFTNPSMLALPELPVVYKEAPAIVVENLTGYYCQISPVVPATAETNGVAGGVAPIGGFSVRVFAPGGAELTQGDAYPGDVSGGNIIIEALLPQDQ